MRLKLFISLCFVCLFTYSQDLIEWKESYRLRSEDFQTNVPEGTNNQIQGMTNAIIDVDFKQNGNVVDVMVYCYFKKSGSWIRSTANQAYTLHHEQGHFDIAEIYARLIRKKLSGITLRKKGGEKQIKKAWNKLYKEYFKYQAKYDKATSHSIKEKAQAEWIKKISEKLKSLEAYKETKVVMRFK